MSFNSMNEMRSD